MLNFFKKKRTDLILPTKDLEGCKTAILAADGFEASELFAPKEALEKAGSEVHIISLYRGKVRSLNQNGFGKGINVDDTVDKANPTDYDFLILPGGVMNSDKLRNDERAVKFVKNFIERHRPIGAICHGVQTLIETGFINGKTLTSWHSLKTDLINAGALWADKEVIVDHRLITSRKPADLSFFIDALLREFKFHHHHDAIPNTESYVVTL